MQKKTQLWGTPQLPSTCQTIMAYHLHSPCIQPGPDPLRCRGSMQCAGPSGSTRGARPLRRHRPLKTQRFQLLHWLRIQTPSSQEKCTPPTIPHLPMPPNHKSPFPRTAWDSPQCSLSLVPCAQQPVLRQDKKARKGQMNRIVNWTARRAGHIMRRSINRIAILSG